MTSGPTQLVSGEGVAFELSHAGIGSRIVATAIDFTIQLVLLVVVLGVTVQAGGNADSAALSAVVIVEVLLGVAGYPIVMEWLARGRTVGKMALGLRAVRDDGGPIGFRQALVRGLAGLVLEKPGLLFPFTTVAGVLTMVFNARGKRLGDLMAGTFVLNERGGPRKTLLAQEFAVPPHLQPWAMSLDLSRLDDQLALSVRQFVLRAREMTPAAQLSLGEDLRARVQAVTAPPPPPGTPTPWVLMTVLAERRRRAELAAPRPPQPAYPGFYPGPPPGQPYPATDPAPYPGPPYAPQPLPPSPTSPFTPPS